MFPFGHIGITLASAALGFGLRDKLRPEISEDDVDDISPTRGSYSLDSQPDIKTSFFRSLASPSY